MPGRLAFVELLAECVSPEYVRRYLLNMMTVADSVIHSRTHAYDMAPSLSSARLAAAAALPPCPAIAAAAARCSWRADAAVSCSRECERQRDGLWLLACASVPLAVAAWLHAARSAACWSKLDIQIHPEVMRSCRSCR